MPEPGGAHLAFHLPSGICISGTDMACPKCGHKTTFRERICPNCRWFAESDRLVEIAPPRLSRWRRLLRPRHMPRFRQIRMTVEGWSDSRLDGFVARNVVGGVRAFRVAMRVIAGVLRILPGVGLVIDGHFVLGVTAAAVVVACLIGAWEAFTPTLANILLGVALSVHIASVFWALPASWLRGAKVRAQAMAGILCAVGYVYMRIWNAIVYQPAYNRALEEAQRRQQNLPPNQHVYVRVQENWDFGGQDIIQLVILAAFVFILMAVIGMFFSADRSIPEANLRRRDGEDEEP